MSVDLIVHDITIVTADMQVGPDAGVAVDDGKIATLGDNDQLP